MDTIKLKVEGMSCDHCKMTVEKSIKSLGGVESVHVNLEKREVTVKASVSRERLVQTIEEAGYEVVH